jgi:hypothetical protein
VGGRITFTLLNSEGLGKAQVGTQSISVLIQLMRFWESKDTTFLRSNIHVAIGLERMALLEVLW